MSISSDLRASARSAYRQLYRASASTFGGDSAMLTAFRYKMREDAISAKSETDPLAYEQYAKHAKEVAEFIKRNIVQASRLPKQETWSLRITKDTELGDNETIKNPSSSKESQRIMYYSTLKRASSQRKVPELKEEDIEESFVRGSGPGGQSVNKTENNVQLYHKPTGIRVSCQETRSLSTNRMLARRLLVAKLDALENPGLSKEEMKRAKQRERERRRRKKAKKKTKQIELESNS
ncbi:hypothetical protein GYMLUDRAFT_74302 [Collybiopsis luxurians FD-317 M1]|uniref:Prokaryotic-type class I peptide chain release factors domain-containing protein n=1 Tax=Collybiopsis luxurians FD-317 M1 TaxID=944289 RepID=A0A0D0B8F1_9AGAR|nr:hypothetical protein GYMLUDRAFT_74302 [Collybiopsis luxurians FD-317 M1]